MRWTVIPSIIHMIPLLSSIISIHPWSGLVLSPDITCKPFNHQQWSQDGKRVKGADQTRPRVMMTGEGRQGDGEMKVVLGPVPLGYSPLPPPYPSLRPQSSLNLHLTEGIVHEGFNQLWS